MNKYIKQALKDIADIILKLFNVVLYTYLFAKYHEIMVPILWFTFITGITTVLILTWINSLIKKVDIKSF